MEQEGGIIIMAYVISLSHIESLYIKILYNLIIN